MEGILRVETASLQLSLGVKCIHGKIEGPRRGLHPTPGRTVYRSPSWLGELFKYVGPDHRGYRHNRRGIEEVRKRWGDKAARAAEIHIERDGELI